MRRSVLKSNLNHWISSSIGRCCGTGCFLCCTRRLVEAIWICYEEIGVEELIVSRLQLLGVLVFTLIHTVSAVVRYLLCWPMGRNESRGRDPFKNVVMQSRRRKCTYPLVRPCVFPQLQRNQPEFCLRKPIDTALAPAVQW